MGLGLTDTACKISPLQLFVVYKSCSTSLAEHFPHIFLTHRALNLSLFTSHPYPLFWAPFFTYMFCVKKKDAVGRHFCLLHFLRWPSYTLFPLFISLLTSPNALVLPPQIASPNDLIKSPHKSIALVTNAQKKDNRACPDPCFPYYNLIMDIPI